MGDPYVGNRDDEVKKQNGEVTRLLQENAKLKGYISQLEKRYDLV